MLDQSGLTREQARDNYFSDKSGDEIALFLVDYATSHPDGRKSISQDKVWLPISNYHRDNIIQRQYPSMLNIRRVPR